MNIYAMKKPKRINSVSVGLFFIGLVIVYAIWAMLPVFWPLWQMSGIMRSACATAYNASDDAAVLERLLRDARRSPLKVDESNFLLERVPYPEEELTDLPPARREQLMEYGRECRLRFRYVDTYELPLLGVEYRLPYESTVSLDLQRNEGGGNVLNDFFYNSCTCSSVRRGR